MSNITDLFDTGVDSAGNILGDNVPDPHYSLTSFPSGTVSPAVTTPPGFPFGYWIANTTTSKWIGPNTSQANGPVGSYTYETTFTIPTSFSTASITGQWATDNEGVNILLNGNPIGITNNNQFYQTIPLPKKEYEQRGRSVVELLSSQTTTQKPQFAHVRHPITVTMPSTADQRYDDAPNEPDDHGHVSNERPSHYVGNLPLGGHWW